MNIQAIETFYKGYRFRSRLEARWAVFFSELGIKWQYEVEGFELPSGRYLPDFYLPDYKCYFEVKPPPFPQRVNFPAVYMAGRMTPPCYRPFTVDERFDDVFDYPRKTIFAEIQARELNGVHITYTGPWRHEGKAHGSLHSSADVYFNGSDMEHYILAKSMAGIKACEVFFAWFDDLEAYGTLVELGMARAMGKRIVVGFAEKEWAHGWWSINPDAAPIPGSHELWFAAECADKVLFGDKETVLAEFGKWLAQEYPIPRELVLARDLHKVTKAGVYVVYGDPVETFSYDVKDLHRPAYMRWGECIFDNEDEKLYIIPPDLDAAALKARQARFEFGQTPV
jgi:hypothetical protein